MKCTICNSSLIIFESEIKSIYSKDKSFEIWVCSNCGCGFTVPVPTESELVEIYRNNYGYDMHTLIKSEKIFRSKKLLSSFVAQNDSQESIVDVGCMYGFFLDASKTYFKKRCGVEIDPHSREVAKRKGYRVEKDIEFFAGDKFDFIVLQHSLEHFLDDISALKKLSQYLSFNGSLVVCVPNFKSYSVRLFCRKWGWYQVPIHIRHYTYDYLSLLGEKAGLKIVKSKTRGADSLMILATIINVFNLQKKISLKIGFLQRIVIKAFSFIFKYYIYFGDEELVVKFIKNTE